MKLTRKSLKLSRKILFSFKKKSNTQKSPPTYDPTGSLSLTPGASTSVMQF